MKKKRCSTFLANREMQTQLLDTQFHPARSNIMKKTTNEEESLSTPAENLNCCSHCGNQYRDSKQTNKQRWGWRDSSVVRALVAFTEDSGSDPSTHRAA